MPQRSQEHVHDLLLFARQLMHHFSDFLFQIIHVFIPFLSSLDPFARVFFTNLILSKNTVVRNTHLWDFRPTGAIFVPKYGRIL